ncbi:MAG: zinc-binding dehydrogenase [Anaerolineae bacterium]|jgi:threonine dehydrogenase-like Zn-dependent dehydrogenase
MPQRLVCTAPGQLAWQEVELPPVGPTQVRIRAQHAAAKHGTEMAFYKGYAVARGRYNSALQLFEPVADPAALYPFAVGNMIVGTVEAAGPSVSRLAVGDRVCVYSGFADVVVREERHCWPLPADMPWQTAVCLDPAEFALGAVRDGHVRLGDNVALFGLGAIGLVVLQLLELAGARQIIAFDPLPTRRELALELGATAALDPTACDAGLELKKVTGGRGVDVAIEYSGALAAFQAALRGVAYGGNIVMGAFPPAYGAGLDLGGEAHHNVPNLIFTRACSVPNRDHPRWDEPRLFDTSWALLTAGKLTGVPIVQPIVPFGTLLDEYPQIATSPQTHIKLGADL